MRYLLSTAVGAALFCGSTVAAAADATIDFGGLPGANGSAFTGPYVEDGYTVSATGGQVFQGKAFGNPEPSLVVGSVFDGGPTGTVQVTGGGLFSLVSFDQIAQNGAGGYSVQGWNGASLLYTLVGSVSGPSFTTFLGNGTAVDRLVFALTSQGTSTNLDNIVLRTGGDGAVPEPGTWILMLAGFGAIGFTMRRTRATAVSAVA